ncbi:LysR family substrate-binding domain-containing protein [Subtercola endophyticus]|uniref:LysR family substrate-binding domain-containing protein n=1 Tax=Subtercola endophyticus TaxID=2895559 RepID=UPI001E29206C|nr:LysR family substrate-binding domain-containing protein [Subtercola endophyticus]UFS59273.1 LysR family substrate-binding domain-containing protein [Subtercola endophyticus]
MSDESTDGPVVGADGTAETETATTVNAETETAETETAETAAAGETSGPAPFRIVFDLGVTVTKWTRLWEQRLPGIPLQVSRSEPESRTAALHAGDADVSFVRHPFARDGLSAIELYSELPVVGVARDHPASVFEVVDVADLADEHLLQPPDDVPEWRDIAIEVAEGSRRPLRGIHSLDDAVEQVGAGVGIVIVPQSIARLHSRKDVVYRPLTGVAETPVSLVWLAENPSPLVEQFIGIVRGRSASSSRGGGAVDARADVNQAAAGSAASAATPPKKIGPVAKAKAKARAAREAEEAASGRPKQNAPRKKTQSEQANKAHARKRKFGGKR